MHIPDGYLSPATAGAMYIVSLPFGAAAVQRVRKTLSRRTVPSLALFSAFAFVLMMFNVPLPGGTSGHAVGGTLLAIVLGPWAAVIGVSVVLAIQALLFGDGGLTTFGANSFNMAVVLPWVGYVVYRTIGARSSATSSRRLIGAIVGSYVGIFMASLVAGIELGIQPVLFHAADGTPLYAPYALNVALPVMAVGHLAVAGVVEAIVTGLVFFYLQKSHSGLLSRTEGPREQHRLWVIGSVALIALGFAVPLGLLAAGTAWGEWGPDELQRMIGYVPNGMKSFADFWKAPIPDYSIPGIGEVPGYVLSAFAGLIVVGGIVWLLARLMLHRKAAGVQVGGGQVKELRGRGFVIRNISSLTRELESIVATDELSRAPGLLQGLDPRVKLLTLALLVVLVGLAQNLLLLAIIFVFTLACALISKVRGWLFLKRLLVFVPVFTALIAIPALFITPGAPFVTLPGNVVITQQGMRTAGFLIMRVIDSLSLALLLVLTTPWAKLLVALRWLRVPSLIVAVLGMTYRYIFLLLHTSNSMFIALRSRMAGGLSGRESRRWQGRALVSTLVKSQHLSDEVYLAMLSRGYQGDARVLSDLRMRRRDVIWICAALLFSAAIVWTIYR